MCHSAEGQYTECLLPNVSLLFVSLLCVIRLSVILLKIKIILLNVILLNIIILIAFLQSVTLLITIQLIVVAPLFIGGNLCLFTSTND